MSEPTVEAVKFWKCWVVIHFPEFPIPLSWSKHHSAIAASFGEAYAKHMLDENADQLKAQQARIAELEEHEAEIARMIPVAGPVVDRISTLLNELAGLKAAREAR